MHLSIHSLQKTLYEGEITKLTLPTTDGEITVLPHHLPLVSTLKKGTAKITTANGETKEFHIEKGVLQVGKDRVVLLLE